MKMSINYKLEGRKWFCLTSPTIWVSKDRASSWCYTGWCWPKARGLPHTANWTWVYSSQPVDVNMVLTWPSALQCLYFSTWESEIMTFLNLPPIVMNLEIFKWIPWKNSKTDGWLYGKLELLEVFLHLKKSFVAIFFN